MNQLKIYQKLLEINKMTEHMSAKQWRQEMGLDGLEFDQVTTGEVKIVNDAVAKKLKRSAESRDKFVKKVGKEFIDEVIVDSTGPVAVRLKNSKTKQTNDSPLEDDVTKQVAQYLDLLMVQNKVLEYSHVPQETFTRSWGIKMKNKAMGVRAGVPDMIILFPKGVLFLELKREKRGKVSEAQERWIQAFKDIFRRNGGEGVYADVGCGFKQSVEIINYWSKEWGF